MFLNLPTVARRGITRVDIYHPWHDITRVEVNTVRLHLDFLEGISCLLTKGFFVKDAQNEQCKNIVWLFCINEVTKKLPHDSGTISPKPLVQFIFNGLFKPCEKW